MRRRLITRGCLLLCGIALGALIAFSIARTIQVREGKVALGKYADRLTRSGVQLSQETDNAVTAVLRDGMPACSDDELGFMRDLVYNAANIKDIGRVRDGRLICSTGLGRLAEPRAEMAPDMTVGETKIYTLVQLALSDHSRGFVTEMHGVSVVLNPDAYKSLDEPPMYYSGLLYDRANHRVLPSFGHGTPLNTDDVIAGRLVERDGVFYQPECAAAGMVCAVAAEKRSSMLAGNSALVVGFLAGGGLLGGALALIVMLMYQRERSIERQLRRAIRTGDLSVVYQPVVDLETGRIVGAEALTRWVNEAGESVKPDLFVALAEERGFVGDITCLVVRRAIEDMSRLLADSDFRVSLNVTSGDLTNERFLAELSRSMTAAGIGPESVGLELTERSAADREIAMEAMARLKHAGHTLYIDDFGTGYSSLAYLHRLEAGAIKVDRAFTQTVGTDAVTASVVPQILDMASKLNLLVVVEGIETKDQAEYFRRAGMGILGQGWLFGKAVPAVQMVRMVREQAKGKAAPAVNGTVRL
jgi:sensor c-di-GMP phosphodiesterase-like protein